mgnify:CR=1 FL=1
MSAGISGRSYAHRCLSTIHTLAPCGEGFFSDDPGEEGKVNSKPYFREVVAAGRTHAGVTPHNVTLDLKNPHAA